MRNRRYSDRDHKRPQVINLYAKNSWVGSFTLGWTDPRFVKPDEIMKTAIRVAHDRPCKRIDDPAVTEVWDELRFHWGIGVFSCNRAGEALAA